MFCSLSPAKINLNLKICGQRDDGMHLIISDMILINLSDQMYFYPRQDGVIRRLWNHSHVSEKDDLSLKAAYLCRQWGAPHLGVDIDIEKKIPVGSGLGGGSSNAATTLLTLNQIWNLEIPRLQLQKMALELGADVPFFIHGQAARASNIGEHLEATNFPKKFFLLIFPPIQCKTAFVYERFQQLTNHEEIATIEGLFATQENDLAVAAMSLYPSLRDTMLELDQMGIKAQLSGSGSTLFVVFDDFKSAAKVRAKLPRKWSAGIVSNLDKHPFIQLYGE